VRAGIVAGSSRQVVGTLADHVRQSGMSDRGRATSRQRRPCRSPCTGAMILRWRTRDATAVTTTAEGVDDDRGCAMAFHSTASTVRSARGRSNAANSSIPSGHGRARSGVISSLEGRFPTCWVMRRREAKGTDTHFACLGSRPGASARRWRRMDYDNFGGEVADREARRRV
jgi:hypothetical protein